jgi:hypothetical protein
MLLSNIFYQNGVSKGKKTQNYFLAISEFSTLANLPGEKLDKLPQFCDEFNALAVESKQKAFLAMAVIPFDKFENEYEDGEIKHLPLKQCQTKQLSKNLVKSVESG